MCGNSRGCIPNAKLARPTGLLNEISTVGSGAAESLLPPGRARKPRADTVAARVSPPSPNSSEASARRLPLWASPACSHCRMLLGHFAQDSGRPTFAPCRSASAGGTCRAFCRRDPGSSPRPCGRGERNRVCRAAADGGDSAWQGTAEPRSLNARSWSDF